MTDACIKFRKRVVPAVYFLSPKLRAAVVDKLYEVRTLKPKMVMHYFMTLY